MPSARNGNICFTIFKVQTIVNYHRGIAKISVTRVGNT